MWKYEKRLQFPVNIKNPNATLAQAIMSQYGGPDGELGASMRYLSQRYSMPYREVAAILTDIGTEELVHRCWWRLCYLSNHLKTTAIGNNTPTATVRSIKQSTSNTPSINFCTIPPMFSPPQHHQQ